MNELPDVVTLLEPECLGVFFQVDGTQEWHYETCYQTVDGQWHRCRWEKFIQPSGVCVYPPTHDDELIAAPEGQVDG